VKVLVFPHHLEIGGSQVNAVDLAAAVRDIYGHEVVFFATPGPGEALLESRGFRLIAAPRPRSSPSPSVARALRQAVRREGADIVHAWDWPQCIDAFFGAQLAGGVPIVGSIMSMVVPTFVPRSIPLTFGTPELLDEAKRRRRGKVSLLEPPVNTYLDDPSAIDGAASRAAFGVEDNDILVVGVSRLVGWMKLEGLLATLDAVGALADQYRLRLLLVGEGSAEGQLRARASEINDRHQRQVVTMPGALVDPRPAYAAADVVVGMGGSILRGMAFGKPAVVLGENGFACTFDEESSKTFLHKGFFGTEDVSARVGTLREQLEKLCANPGRRDALGAYSSRIIRERFALPVLAASVEQLYRETLNERVGRARLIGEGVKVLGRRAAAVALPNRAKAALRRVLKRSR